MRYFSLFRGKMIIENEQQLMSLLQREPKLFPHKILGFNVGVKGFYSRQNIGQIDFKFSRSRVIYLVEVKMKKLGNREERFSGDFWTSLKILGYTAAERVHSPKRTVKPCIMLRKEAFTNDILCVLGRLKISYITINLSQDMPKFETFL